MSAIPASGEINVDDAPKISNTEFVRQVIQNIKAQIHLVHDEISAASANGGAQVAELSAFADQIESSATHAILLISNVSADDGSLSLFNKSLDGSCKTLKKLEALVESIKELELELKEAQYDYYRNVAEMLTDVKQQMAYFNAYAAIPHVMLVQSKISAIESELQRHIQWCCREIGQLVNSDPNSDTDGPVAESAIDLQTLSQLYLVIDILGVPFRKDLLERFAQLQLIPYEKAFGHPAKLSGLEQLDRRYAWFKRLLKTADDRVSSIFPASWNLPYHLFVEFSRRTSRHMADVLSHAETGATEATVHVASLLKALKSVLKFEAEMKASFDIQNKAIESESDNDKKLIFLAPTSIAVAFDDYLGPYVQLERESLETLMGTLMREEEASIREGESNQNTTVHIKEPYVSSQKMFEFIKSSLKRCTAFSTGNTYLSLSKEFRICLQHYAESLRFRCPSPVSAKFKYVISPTGEQQLSRIVATGEYCIDTVPQLEVIMKNHINPQLCGEIDFSVQIDAFVEMVSFTYSVMTAGITERLEPAMKMLRKTNFSTADSIGDDSKYVKEITKVLNEAIPRIRPCMSASYFQGFCIKLVAAVLAKFLESIWLLKCISQTGGGQLLLDLQGIKTYLQNMPNTRLAVGEEALVISKAYNSLLGSKAFPIERVLKLVCSEDAMLQNTFKALWPDGKPSDLEAVVALKGSGNAVMNVINVVNPNNVVKGATVAAGEISHGITHGVKAVGGGFKDLITGKMFEDVSTHSQRSKEDDNHSYTPPVHQPQNNGGRGSSASQAASKALGAMGDVKNAFGSFNLFGPSPPTHNSSHNHNGNHSNNTNNNSGTTPVKKQSDSGTTPVKKQSASTTANAGHK